MTDITSIISEPLVKEGIAGAVILYFIVTDFISRRADRRIEDARIQRENNRELKAQEREDACAKNMRDLQDQHKKEIHSLAKQSNDVMQELAKVVRRHFKVTIDTPTPELETTTLIRKQKDSRHGH